MLTAGGLEVQHAVANVLFNDAINTFYLRLFVFGQFIYIHHPTDKTVVHATAFVIPIVKQWLERKVVQWIHHGESTRRPTAS